MKLLTNPAFFEEEIRILKLNIIPIIVVIMPAAIANNIVLSEAEINLVEKIFSISIDQLIISRTGIINPTNMGIKQINKAKIFFKPERLSNFTCSFVSLAKEN